MNLGVEEKGAVVVLKRTYIARDQEERSNFGKDTPTSRNGD